MEKTLRITSHVEGASFSNLKSLTFKTAQELIDKFNASKATEVDKTYLRTAILTIFSLFKLQPVKTQMLMEALIPLALVDDEEVYSALINLLSKEFNKTEIVTSNFVFKALIQALWMNEKQPLNIKALGRLLNIALAKIDLDVNNLALFGELFDAMGKEGVKGIEKIQREQFEKKFQVLLHDLKNDKAWKYKDDKEELIYRIHYAHQALLRIGTNETQAEKLKRRFFAAFSGFTKFAGVVTSLTSVALTGGATAAFGIPEAILGLIDSAKDFKKAFKTTSRAKWYADLQTLQAALLEKAWKKEKYTVKEVNLINEEFKQITQANLNHYVKYGIIDTLNQIIQHHPDEKVKEISLEVLEAYAKDGHLQSKIVHTLAELAVKVSEIQDNITTIITELNLQAKYDEIKSKLEEQIKAPTPLAINLIEQGQKQANNLLQLGNADEVKAVTKAIIKIAMFEEGSEVTGGYYERNKLGLAQIKAVEGASEEEHERIRKILNQIQEGANEIKVVCVEKGAVVKDVTMKNNKIGLIQYEIKERKYKLPESQNEQPLSIAKAINERREKEGLQQVALIQEIGDWQNKQQSQINKICKEYFEKLDSEIDADPSLREDYKREKAEIKSLLDSLTEKELKSLLSELKNNPDPLIEYYIKTNSRLIK